MAPKAITPTRLVTALAVVLGVALAILLLTPGEPPAPVPPQAPHAAQLAPRPKTPSTPPAGRVFSLLNRAHVIRNGQEIPLTEGSPLHAGDAVRTGKLARLFIKLADAGEISLGAETDFNVDAYAYSPVSETGEGRLQLETGMALAATGRLGERPNPPFTLKTPVATLGVRGTRFWTQAARPPPPAAPKMGMICRSPSCVVTNPQGEQLVEAANRAILVTAPDRPPDPPRKATLAILLRAHMGVVIPRQLPPPPRGKLRERLSDSLVNEGLPRDKLPPGERLGQAVDKLVSFEEWDLTRETLTKRLALEVELNNRAEALRAALSPADRAALTAWEAAVKTEKRALQTQLNQRLRALLGETAYAQYRRTDLDADIQDLSPKQRQTLLENLLPRQAMGALERFTLSAEKSRQTLAQRQTGDMTRALSPDGRRQVAQIQALERDRDRIADAPLWHIIHPPISLTLVADNARQSIETAASRVAERVRTGEPLTIENLTRLLEEAVAELTATEEAEDLLSALENIAVEGSAAAETAAAEVTTAETTTSAAAEETTASSSSYSANKAPESIALSGDSVPENSEAGTAVGTFSAIDPEGASMSFSLTDTGGGAFTLSGTTLAVSADDSLNYEEQSSYSVTVQVTDAAGKSASATFTITVTDEKEAPKSVSVTPDEVPRVRTDGLRVGTLTVVEEDAGETVTLEMTDDLDGRFYIGGDDGDELWMSQRTIAEGEHAIGFRATDSFGLYLDTTVTVDVLGNACDNIPSDQTSVASMASSAQTTYETLKANFESAASGTTTGISEATLEEMIIGKLSQQLTGSQFSLTDLVKNFDIEIKVLDDNTEITAMAEVGVVNLLFNRLPSSVLTTAQSLFKTSGNYSSDYTACVLFRVAMATTGSGTVTYDSSESTVKVVHDASLYPDLTLSLDTLRQEYNNQLSDLSTSGGLSFFTIYEDAASQTVPSSQSLDYYFPGNVSSFSITDGTVHLIK